MATFPGSEQQLALLTAVRSGELSAVSSLLEADVSPSFKDQNGQTALDYAAKLKSDEVAVSTQCDILRLLCGESAWKEGEEEARAAFICNQANDGKTALFTAITNNCDVEVVKTLVESCEGLINIVDKLGQSAVFFAASHLNDPSILKYLMDSNANLSLLDTFGSTVLHWAAFRNRHECCRLLITDGQMDVTAKNKKNATPTDYAFRRGHEATAAVFKELGVEAPPLLPLATQGVKRPGQGQHALQTPAKQGRLGVADAAAAPGGAAANGNSPEAAQEKVNAILQQGVSLDAPGLNGIVPLCAAGLQGDSNYVRALLEAQANPAVVNPGDGRTVLHYIMLGARDRGLSGQVPATTQCELVRLLCGDPVWKEDQDEARTTFICKQANDGKTALFSAIVNGCTLEVVKTLVECCNELIDIVDKLGQSAVFYAASHLEDPAILKYLMESEANLSLLDTFGSTALHWAAFRNRPACCRLLIVEGQLDATLKNKQNSSPTDYAFRQGHEATAAVFRELGMQAPAPLAADAGSAKRPAPGPQLLQATPKRGRVSGTTTPVGGGSAIEAHMASLACAVSRPLTEKERKKAEERAILQAAQDKVNGILHQGASLDAPGPNGIVPLCAAGLQGDIALIRALLSAQANPAAINPSDGRNVLHYMILGARERAQARIPGQVELKKTLAKFVGTFIRDDRADPNLLDMEQKSPIHLAIETKWWDMRKKLEDWAKKRMSDAERARVEGHQPHIANMKNLAECLADPNYKDIATKLAEFPGVCHWGVIFKEHCEAGRVPKVMSPALLHLVAARKAADIVQIAQALVTHANFDVNCKERKTGETALFAAARHGVADLCTYLLEKGANVNHVDSGLHMTALFTAVRYKRLQVVKVLIEHGANVHHQDKNQVQAIHTAVDCGFESAVPELVAAKANVDCRDKRGISPLQMAISNSRATLAVRLLQEFGATVLQAVNSNLEANSNLFDMARERGMIEVEQALTVVKERQEQECTFVSQVAGMSLDEFIYTLEQGMNPNGVGPGGSRPLHEAARRKDGTAAEACRILIEDYDANVHLVNRKGETAMFNVINAGLLDTIKLMVAKKADLNYQSKEGLTPLQIASLTRQAPIAHYFIDQGADITKVDNAQRTLLHVSSDASVAERLLKTGQIDLNVRDKTKRTALFVATEKNLLKVMKYLLDANIDTRALNKDKKTALFFAKTPEAVRLLLDHDPGLANVVDKKGDSALHATIANPTLKLDTIKAMIEKGVNYMAKNKKGQTALIFAIQGGHKNHWLPVVSELICEGSQLGPAQIEEARKVANRTRSCPLDIQCYLNQVCDMMGEKKAENWIRSKGYKIEQYYLHQVGLNDSAEYSQDDKAWFRALRHTRKDFPSFCADRFGVQRAIEPYFGFHKHYKYTRVDAGIDWEDIRVRAMADLAKDSRIPLHIEGETEEEQRERFQQEPGAEAAAAKARARAEEAAAAEAEAEAEAEEEEAAAAEAEAGAEEEAAAAAAADVQEAAAAGDGAEAEARAEAEAEPVAEAEEAAATEAAAAAAAEPQEQDKQPQEGKSRSPSLGAMPAQKLVNTLDPAHNV